MARQMMDYGLTNNKTLTIVDGDFVIVESTAEHQVQLLLNNKGDFKSDPTVAVGAINYIDDEGVNNLIQAMSTEFQKDGMDVKSIQLAANGTIESDAYYK